VETKILEDDSSSSAWNNYVCGNHNSHVIQSWEWGTFRKFWGTPPIRVALFEKDSIVATAQFTLHHVPFSKYFVGYLPKGPTVSDLKYLKPLLEEIKKLAYEKNCIFVKIEPNVPREEKNWEEIFEEVGLVKSPKTIFAPQTLLLDLTKTEEELLQNMHPKWRYNIRLAAKRGVKVEQKEDRESLEEFILLQKETAKRDKFFIHPDDYFRKLWEVFQPKEMAFLLSARVDEKTIASWFLFKFGKTLYYPYGASDYNYRSFMSSHALFWAAVELGKKLDCERFDLWGAADESAPESDPWYGFTRFKEGFGPQRVSFIGAYDLIINPTLYKLFNITDKIRWFILKATRR